MSTSPTDVEVAIGRIERPHGVRGEASVVPLFDGDPKRFVETRVVIANAAGRREVRCVSARAHGKRWLLGFEGIETPEEVRKIAGTTIFVRSDVLPPSSPLAPYHFELLGLEVVDRKGNRLGRVERIDEAPAGDLLILDPAGELMIPFRPMVVEVDRVAGRIVVEIPDGLLDVNRRTSR